MLFISASLLLYSAVIVPFQICMWDYTDPCHTVPTLRFDMFVDAFFMVRQTALAQSGCESSTMIWRIMTCITQTMLSDVTDFGCSKVFLLIERIPFWTGSLRFFANSLLPFTTRTAPMKISFPLWRQDTCYLRADLGLILWQAFRGHTWTSGLTRRAYIIDYTWLVYHHNKFHS